MQQNILTVIIPTFNDSKNIYRCLQSVSNQSFKNIEIIVINDASTDNTLEILETYNCQGAACRQYLKATACISWFVSSWFDSLGNTA